MKAVLYTDDLREAQVDLLAVGVFSDEPDRGLAFSHLNRALDGALEEVCRDEDFKGKAGQVVVFNASNGVRARRVLAYGYGERKKYTAETARQFAGTVARMAQKVSARSCALQLAVPEAPAPQDQVLRLVSALSEGALLGSYVYGEHRTKDKKEATLKDLRIAFVAEDVQGVKGAALRDALHRGQVIGGAVTLARDLVNAPANVMTPIQLADAARKIAKAHDLGLRVLNPRDLEKQDMHLHLGVGRGSRNEPRLIHLTYSPEVAGDGRVVALVGKGLTFDAGGLSLKTAEGMMDMKADMAGGAAVLASMQAIAELKPACTVHGIVGAAENMPDGNAIRPGDVLRSKRGLTVEVLNTDAEGRLVLADALAYAQDQKPSEIIDVATLTGACVIALGRNVAGAFANHESMAVALERAWQESGELFWHMPLQPELRELLNSDVADIKNVGERYGGAITAALFLKEFVDEGMKWAHLDIAGPVLAAKESGHVPKGATGFGVRTLIEYVLGKGPAADE